MERKYFRVCSLILALALTLAAAGCSSGGKTSATGENASGSTANSFDYGIILNIPNDWNPDSYRVTATENPVPYLWSEDYPPLYLVSMEYLHEGKDPYTMFQLYVMNWVDWNDVMLMSAYGPPPGEDIRLDGKLAYVLTGLPQDMPFDDDPSRQEFGRFMEDIGVFEAQYESIGFIALNGKTDRTPTQTVSRTETVECGFGDLYLSIPTSWNYRLLDIASEFDTELGGYAAVESVTYSLNTLPGASETLFEAHVFTNDVWARIESDAGDGPPIATKAAANGEYTLAVVLPQDNPLDRDSDEGKQFDRMQEDIRDLGAFFKLY